MTKINLPSEEIIEVFKKYCGNKNYQIDVNKGASEEWRLDISNIRERTLVIVYRTGSVVMGGKKNELKLEFSGIMEDFASNPEKYVGHTIEEIKGQANRYEIVSDNIRKRIRDGLNVLDGSVEITENPNASTEYKAKITRGQSSVTMTQYSTGTLLLQGKTDKIFHDACDWIEKIANPSEEEVIARFISSNEENLEKFAARYTPKLLEMAEKNVREALGDVYEYVEEYDQKWFVASECLCLSEIPLPEFSPLVMPASKAFEGFLKKLLVDIGLFDPSHFQTTNANFSALNTMDDPKRKSICEKERHANTMLKKTDLCLKTNRHFMMHSDESTITKINSAEEAREKVNTIFKEAKEIFEYFNGLYKLTVR